MVWYELTPFKASLVAQTVKASACNGGDPGSIPGSGRSLGEASGNPFKCVEACFMDGIWSVLVYVFLVHLKRVFSMIKLNACSVNISEVVCSRLLSLY